MSRAVVYAVDLDQLEQVVADLAACRDAYEQVLDDVRRRVERLHVTWSGQAALAHETAQREWEAGFAAIQQGLAEMRAAAATAHANYRTAVAANVALWSGV